MELPDVVGFTLEKAAEALNNAGFTEQQTVMTAAPRMPLGKAEGNSRVLRIRKLDHNKVELIVCSKPDKNPS